MNRMLMTTVVLAFLRPWDSNAILQIDGPTTDWTVIRYAGTNQVDYFNDQQTGQPEADIVGNATHAAFYYIFDNGGTPGPTEATLAFRVRLGSDLPQADSFESVLFIGVDGNNDGALDIFLGADNSQMTPMVRIWDAGTDLNISPNTTSISAPANQKTYLLTPDNYHFAQISLTLDPVAKSFDLDSDGATDRFLSFALPFADLVSEMSRLAGIAINETSPLRYVVATATQQNALNQDLGGAPNAYNGDLTWEELGTLSNPTPVPEPGAFALLAGGLLIVALRSRASGQW